MTTDRSYTSNSIAPTESAAEYAHRVLGAPHPDEDTDRLQRTEYVRTQIVDVTAYLDDMHDDPVARESRTFDTYVDYLSDLKDEFAELTESE